MDPEFGAGTTWLASNLKYIAEKLVKIPP